MKLLKYITLYIIFYIINTITFVSPPKSQLNNNKHYYKILILKTSKKIKHNYLLNKPYIINITTIEIFEYIFDIFLV